MSVHENLQRHSRESGNPVIRGTWMPRHAREGGDCAGVTILAAVMINSRLDRYGESPDYELEIPGGKKPSLG
jgi:hypothetical protein